MRFASVYRSGTRLGILSIVHTLRLLTDCQGYQIPWDTFMVDGIAFTNSGVNPSLREYRSRDVLEVPPIVRPQGSVSVKSLLPCLVTIERFGLVVKFMSLFSLQCNYIPQVE